MRRLLIALLACVGVIPFVAHADTFEDTCIRVEPGQGWFWVSNQFAPGLTGEERDAFIELIKAQIRYGPLWANMVICIDPSTIPEVPPSTTTTTVAPTTTSTTTTTLAPATTTTLASTTTTSTTTTVAPTTTTGTTQPPTGLRFPTRESAGTPDGWVPTRTINGGHTITTPGAVVEDIRIVNGNLNIRAQNVTVRRVEIVNGRVINRYSGVCYGGFLMEDVSILGPYDGNFGNPAVTSGDYTARNVLVDGMSEGLRSSGCGPVLIEHSYVRVVPPPNCQPSTWHGDAAQAYMGPHMTVRDSVLISDGIPGCAGNAAFFVPANQGNESATIDGLIASGGGYPVRFDMPGSVDDLFIIEDSWLFNPFAVTCGGFTSWDAHLATWGADGQPVVGEELPCRD